MRRSFTLALLALALVPAVAAAAPLNGSNAAYDGGLLGSIEASAEGLSDVLAEFPSAEGRAGFVATPVTFVVGLDNASPEVVEVIPEPATLWLFGSGLAFAASRLRKAKK